MRKELAIGICFCIAGILTVCFFGYTYFTTYGFLNTYHMQAFAETKLEVSALLANIIWERGKLFLLICLVAYTPLKKVAPLVLRCGICFTAGVFLAASMLNMGDSWHCIFHNVAFPSLFVLFDGVASYFRSGYTQFLQSEESGSEESDLLWSGWNCIFAWMYF